MNTFRMELLKDRAEKIRPDLSKAREITEKAEAEKRELTDEERAFVDPVLKSAREIADGMAKLRDDDAMMSAINDTIGDIMGRRWADRPNRTSRAVFRSRAWEVKSPPGCCRTVRRH